MPKILEILLHDVTVYEKWVEAALQVANIGASDSG